MSRVPAASSPAPASEVAPGPKAELHLHLRGAVPVAYLRQRLAKYGAALVLGCVPKAQRDWMHAHPGIRCLLESEEPERELDRLFEYATFEQFLAAYLLTSYFVRDLEDFRDLVAAVRQGLRSRGIVYAEISVSVPEYMAQGLELSELLAVLSESPPDPPAVRWIVDLVRNFGPAAAETLLERILPHRPATVVGLTLGGAEHAHPPAPFRRVYEMARESGLRTTVHAGEALGPESVWAALQILGVERIGHGVRAAEDPRLVRHLAELGVPLEVCPTSNIRTGVYRSLRDHPVRALYEAGVPLTISTDDPTFFGVTLDDELANLLRLGFSEAEIATVAGNAFRYAFDPAAAARARARAGS